MSKKYIVNENGELETIHIDKKEDVIELKLSFLNISSINDNIFFNDDNSQKFPNLKILDLSNNNLSDLEWFPDLFDKGIFENLEILKLNNNEITYVNYTFFEKLPKLKELHLAFNKIYTINSTSFSDDNTKLPLLENIYLNNNFISQLSDTLEIIKSDTPFLKNELYSLNPEEIIINNENIDNNSIFVNLNDNVKIDIHNNLLIKCDIDKIKITKTSMKIINYSYIYNFYMDYYYQHPRLLFKRYNNHYSYIEYIEENGINTFIDYFIYFIYKSLPTSKSDTYLSFFLILNGKLASLVEEEKIDELLSENRSKNFYKYIHNHEDNIINMDEIINNIKNKEDVTKIYEKNLNDYIEILFKINEYFYKQNNSIILEIKNIIDDDIDDDNDKKNKYKLDYLNRTFIIFNKIIYHLNSNIILKYKNPNNTLFINNLFDIYKYHIKIDSNFLIKNELNQIFKNIIINFNESIKNFSNELKVKFENFKSNYIFPEKKQNLNQTSNTVKYYRKLNGHIDFLNKNIQYILLNEDDWNLLFKEEYKNEYKSILQYIYIYLEQNNFYLYFLLINNDEFMNYDSNYFFYNIIDLYKKCALNLYIQKSNNIIFYNLLKYLNLYNNKKNEFNINHLTAIQIDSLMDYYIMYMNELYNNYHITNHYILEPYNLPINLENVVRTTKINNYINKYLFIASSMDDIQLKYNEKRINKYFYKDYILTYFDKFRIISGHGNTIKDTLNIIPENQTVHFLAKSKVNLLSLLKSTKNKYTHNIPYIGVYERGLDKFENYYITRPLYKTQKYNNGMLCESYALQPKSVYDNKYVSLNININKALQLWRYSGIFKINNIFKNVCNIDSYKKYANSINRKNNIFMNSIYENNYSLVIDYSFISKKTQDIVLKNLYKNRKLNSKKELSEEIKNKILKELSEENKNNFYKELSEENIKIFNKNFYKNIASIKSMYIDFLENILFAESDQSYFNRNEMMQFYLKPNYVEEENKINKLIYFLKKNVHTPHTYFIHMCRGADEKSNNKLLKHILKNIIQLHLLVESKKKYINKLIAKNSSLIKRNSLLPPPVENNSIFLENINVKGAQLLNKNNSQISLSTQFSEDHFDVNNYNLYKIYQDMSHIINIYQKNYPKEQLRNNYHLNMIVEGLEELYNFIYESYEISYEDMYKILKKLLVLKKLVFTHINVEIIEGVGINRRTSLNISQSYKKENNTNILQLSESNKEKHKVAKNSKLKDKKRYASNNLVTFTKRKIIN